MPDRNQTPFEPIGGEEQFRELVDRFYDYMDSMPEARTIRGLDAESSPELFSRAAGTKPRALRVGRGR